MFYDYSLPLGAFAVAVTIEQKDAVESASVDKYTYELTDRRDAYSKHFHNPDGTNTAVSYAMPVHRLNENGEWVMIDNTLLNASANEYATSDARIKFAKKTTGNEVLFTLHDGNYKITMSLDGANKKIPGIITNYEADENADEITKLSQLNKLNSAIRYNGILEGVDLEYITSSDRIKENIIVNQPLDGYTFTFTMKLNNLTAEMAEDGGIAVMNEDGVTVYCIAPPYMYDANDNLSMAVFYSLTQIKNKEYALTVTADENWIHAPERVFPVTIDPSVSPMDSEVLDTYIDSTESGVYQDTWPYLVAGKQDQAIAYWRTSTFPALPYYAYITSCTMTLTIQNRNDNMIGVYPVTSNWDDELLWETATANVSNPPGQFATTPIDFVAISSQTDNATNNKVVFDITDTVKNWMNGGTNYGIAFASCLTQENVLPVTFYSNDYHLSANRPRLMITYKDQFGIEDYWTYFTYDAGLAGVASVNLANGFLVYNTGTLTTTDSLMPFTPTLVYNAKLDWGLYTRYNREVPYSYATIAGGWQTNMNQSLVPRTRVNERGETETYYIYNDADGTYHSFFPGADENESNVYYDEDGLKLKLTIDADNYFITDSSYNTYTFTKKDVGDSYQAAGGFLESITDAVGNMISFSPNTYGRPQSIMLTPKNDPAVTQLMIDYTAKSVIQSVRNPATNQAVFLYYSDSVDGTIGNYYRYLRRIVYAHADPDNSSVDWDAFYANGYTTPTSNSQVTVDAVCEYEYDANSRLVRAYDGLSGIEYRYTYDASERLTKIEQTASGTTGQTVSFIYGTGYTRIRNSGTNDIYGDSDDIITNYVFDAEGRCINCYTTDILGFTIYGASQGAYEDTVEKAKNKLSRASVVSDVATNYLLNGNFENNSATNLAYWETSGDVSWEAATFNYMSDGTLATQYDSDFNVDMTATAGVPASLSQTVRLHPGKYTFSVDTLKLADLEANAYLQVDPLTAGEETVTEPIVYSKYISVGNEAQSSITFEVPGTDSNMVKLYTVSVILESTAGTSQSIWINKASLVNDIGGGLFSRVQYGSFETSGYSGSAAIPVTAFWTASGAATTPQTRSVADYAGNSLYMVGQIDKEYTVSQTVFKVSNSEKNQFISRNGVLTSPNTKRYRVSAMAKFMGAVMPSAKHEVRIEVSIAKIVNGAYTIDRTEIKTLNYNSHTDGWQFLSDFIILENAFVDEIKIVCDYSNQLGEAYFDDIAVCYLSTDEEISSVKYDENGNPQKVQTGSTVTWYGYDDDDNPNSPTAVVSNHSATVYQYNRDHTVNRVLYYDYSGDASLEYYGWTSASASGLTPRNTTAYTYNAYGLLTDTITTAQGAGGTETIVASTDYYVNGETDSSIFGAVKTETDSFDQTTRYYYDPDFGYLLAVITPDENGTVYTYDALGRIDTVLPATVGSTAGYAAVTGAANVDYGYDAFSRLHTITTGSTTYTLLYDGFGNTTSVVAGDKTIASYTYNGHNGKLRSLTYGNGNSVRYVYNDLDKITEIWYKYSSSSTETLAYAYTYDADGNLHTFTDYVSSQITWYKYDHNGRMKEYYVTTLTDSDTQYSEYWEYDGEGRPSHGESIQYYAVGTAQKALHGSFDYTYSDIDGSLTAFNQSYLGMVEQTVYNLQYAYDGFGRMTSETQTLSHTPSAVLTTQTSMEKAYTYRSPSSGRTSMLVEEVTYGLPRTADDHGLHYTYENTTGFITSISRRVNGVDTLLVSYVYDDMGQLVRENNVVRNETYVYTYDDAGNILTKTIYSYTAADPITAVPKDTIPYAYNDSYGRGDLLTAYDGRTIPYDALGNPYGYTDPNGNYYMLYWMQGRRLEAMSCYNVANLSFTYNDEGIRTTKIVNGVEHRYTLSGSTIMAEEWTEDGVEHRIQYRYDAKGTILGMQYTNSSISVFHNFLFVTNLQGDVIYIYDDEGNKLVSYTYDAWGNHTVTYTNGGASTAAVYNPFRYRGYYYDVETGLYYLNSRYYNSQIGRFINADAYVSTGQGLLGYNMFAYCGNNPINRLDLNGEFWFELVLFVAVVLTVGITATGCGDPNESLEGTPADPKSKRSFDTYDEALETMISETYNSAKAVGFKYEYGAAIYQYEGDPKYYTDGTRTDCKPTGIYYEKSYPSEDQNVILIAFIHTHPWDPEPNSSPFNSTDLNYDNPLPDRYVITRNYVYRLAPGIKDVYKGWEIYK